MKRDEWTFTYVAADLAKAAEAKRQKHAERLAWWEDKKRHTMKEVSARGIDVQDSAGAGVTSARGANFGPRIVIDGSLQRDLTECAEKIAEHDTAQREYAAWVQVLSGNPEAKLNLDHSDWLFFYGR